MTSTVIGKQKRQSQPRTVKHQPKPFPFLTTPRIEACSTLGYLCFIFAVAALEPASFVAI